MDYLNLMNDKGELVERVPHVQFSLYAKKNIAVLGMDSDKMGGFQHSDPMNPVKAELWGKLDDMDGLFKIFIEECLAMTDWDWDKYPNPEIYLLTKTNPNEN